jgi:hypothetical protein
MNFQLDFDFTHTRENNPLSEAHLEQFKEKFSRDCFEILKRLVAGEELTVEIAVLSKLTNSLPRRIKDLRDKWQVKISDQWVLNNEGKRSHMKWFMNEADKVESLKVLLNRMKEAA